MFPRKISFLRERTLDPDDPIDIQYTSGTTGFPKGATLSHHNILNNGYFVGRTLKYSEQDRICVPVPLYHCFGQVMANLAATSHGACLVYPAEAFDAGTVLSTIENERCTSLYGVPTMFIAEMEHANFSKTNFSSLRTGIMAGSPCPIEVMKRVQKDMHMPEITICYGMTETSPVSTQSKVDDPLEKRVATVGCVHPNLEIKLVDPNTGHVVPRGSVGELCTRGYSVMLGYWNDMHSTRQAIDAARWMHSGDLATMDDDGYVNIVGRIKDMVMRGGENIYPREVEEFLYTKPEVADVQVIGVPDAKYGEEVMAWIKLRPGASLTGDDLRAFCKGKIATYKIPRYWKFVDAFPMTVTGKIQKYKMREIAVDELKLQTAANIRRRSTRVGSPPALLAAHHRGRVWEPFEGSHYYSTLWKNLRQRMDENHSEMPEGLSPPRAGSRDHQMTRARPLMRSMGTKPQTRESFELSRLSPMAK
jgi:fatty-acyl-CoA synthase